MTQEEKAKAYDEVREKIALRFGSNVAEEIFSEFEMSKDEKVRKALIGGFKRYEGRALFNGCLVREILLWLEKQGDKQQKTSMWKHWENGIAGNGEGEPIYLTKVGNTYSLTSCLGFECDYIELSELDKLSSQEKQGQKPAWSEEDEVRLQACIDTLQAKSIMGKVDTIQTNWLKSLKQRYTWKPSKEQMDAMQMAVSYFGYSWTSKEQKLLESLYKDLKKL